jgi:hypothetical protein
VLLLVGISLSTIDKETRICQPFPDCGHQFAFEQGLTRSARGWCQPFEYGYWPNQLQRLGETRAGGTPAQIRNILDRIAEAMHSTSAEVRVYMKEHPDFADIGERLLHEWVKGIAISLRI